jgi:hypothetical protein
VRLDVELQIRLNGLLVVGRPSPSLCVSSTRGARRRDQQLLMVGAPDRIESQGGDPGVSSAAIEDEDALG